jgi:tripartite-type tricarboxylate transporter receptor subunit TctC
MTKKTAMLQAAAALMVALSFFGGAAKAVGYPERPIRLIAPFPPGGFTDVVTRRAAVTLSKELGQSVIVENRPGAGTNIGTEYVARAAADGYTLLVGTSSLAINPTLYPHLTFDAQKDLRPIGILSTTGYTLIANNDFPAATTEELLTYAKKHPGEVVFGSSGNGAVNHLAAVTFMQQAEIKMLHIPYRGSQAAITDLLGGRIQLFWASTLEALPLVNAHRAKAFGVTDAAPVKALSGVAPLGAAVPGYEVKYWMGLFAPAGVSDEIVNRVSQALKANSWLPRRPRSCCVKTPCVGDRSSRLLAQVSSE